MKNNLKRLLMLFLALTLTLCLFSCGLFGDKPAQEEEQDDTTTIDLSGVRLSDKTFVYDGESKSITVTGTLPAGVTVQYEGNGQVNAGTYTVTAKFALDGAYLEGYDKTAVLTIAKASFDMSGVSFSGVKKTYDGVEIVPSITGTLPEGVTVSYDADGKTILNAGTYKVKAVFTTPDDENYNAIPTIVATFVINKADYDMTNFSFKDYTTVYNGSVITPAASGELPDGVSVRYEVDGGREIKNAGTYTVTASFTVNNKNYNSISDMVATYTVRKATYDMSAVSFSDAIRNYSADVITPSITGTLPDGVTVRYEIEGGKEIKEIGTYTVTAIFTGDSDNYNPISSMTAQYNVIETEYDMSGISFAGFTKQYDGVAVTPSITGTLPEGVSVSYVIEGGEEIKNVGTYTVTAKFSVAVGNNNIPDMRATFVITKLTYDTTGKFESITVMFDGQYHSIVLTDLPSQITAVYEGNSVRNIGVYTVKVTFYADENNCEIPAPMTATITIERGNYVSSGLTYSERGDGTYEVTGYIGSEDFIMIPETYRGVEVTSIKSNAFSGNTALSYAYIPDSITNIGNNAFFGCTALTEVRMSGALKVLGAQAFGSTSITNMVLPDTLQVIGHGAFADTSLVSITIPFVGGSHLSSNSHLGYIFGGSNEGFVPATLKYVTISNACTEISAYAFSNCTNIVNIVIGNGVTRIGNSAFANCVSIETIYIPASVVQIPANTYWYNSPFMGCNEDLVIVTGGEYNAEWGKYWSKLTETAGATVVYGKTYEEYLANKDSYKDVDVESADLNTIFVNDTFLSGFNRDVYEYTVDADINVGYGIIEAEAASSVASVSLTQATTDNNGVATIVVISGDGATTKTYTIRFNIVGTLNNSSVIVNKDGASATVSFVIDDGNKTTGKFAKLMLEKYEELSFSFAIPAKNFATLTVDSDTNEYVMVDGKYTYTQTDTQASNVRFWEDVLSVGRSEIINHTYTHGFWGLNDDGGVFRYLKDDGTTIVTSALLPKGSSSKEIYASNQIIADIFARDIYPSQYQMTFVHAGIGIYTKQKTIDGEVFVPYSTYFNKILDEAMKNGTFIGGRSTFNAKTTSASKSNVVTPEWMQSASNRLKVPGYMIVTENRNSTGSLNEGGIDNWTAFIDHAVDKGGLATFCIHNIFATVADHTDHKITEADAEELFVYAIEKNVWVAEFTDAVMYYSEWSTANVSSEYSDGKVKVTLTDGEDDEIYNMALTVKVNVPATWNSANCNGEFLEVYINEDGSRYVYVNIVPDSGVVEITAG